MRRLALGLMLAITALPASAADVTGTDWQLLAIDGVFTDAPATLRIGADGTISGTAPCNGFSGTSQAALPALALTGLSATRRACDRLADETAFFEALTVMTEAKVAGLPRRNLILTGPDGRSMEFVTEVMNSLTRCLTCAAQD